MGYRSDIRIATTKKGFKKICDDFKKNMGDKIFEDYSLIRYYENGKVDSDSFDFYEKNDKYVVFGWDYLKWYEGCNGYEDVNSIMNSLEEMDNKIPYKFIEIGEDYCDIKIKDNIYMKNGKEEDWTCYELIDVERTISCYL